MKKTARKKDEHSALRFHFSEICSWVDDHGREPSPFSTDMVEFHLGVMLQTLRQDGAEKGWLEPLLPYDRHGLLPRVTAVEEASASPEQ